MKGISFKPEMVRKIVAGEKTQTRRLPKEQPRQIGKHVWIYKEKTYRRKGLEVALIRDAHYEAGEIVYVKEAIRESNRTVIYESDDFGIQILWKWKPNRLAAMYMPQILARTYLIIPTVRAEPLQEISEEDAIAEGVEYYTPRETGMLKGREQENPSEAYRELWDSINGKKAPWNDAPWVIIYTFEKVPKPTV